MFFSIGGFAVVLPNAKTKMNIVVTGDVTIDWNLSRINRGTTREFTWNPDDITHTSWQRGGAALLADLIAAIAKSLEADSNLNFSLFQPGTPTTSVDPTNPNYHHCFAIWSLYKDGRGMVWRVDEFLGIDRSTTDPEVQSMGLSIVDDPPTADLIVIDDASMGFRDHQGFWPRCLLNQKNNPWIILKMSQPIGRGPLWEYLLTNFSDRMIVLTTVSDLRRTEVQISKGLSWERTAQDLVWELMHNPQINSLSRCACIVVSFGAAGAVIHTKPAIEQAATKPTGTTLGLSQLVFDPGVIEGTWEADHPGGMIGYTTCLAGGIARQIMISPDSAELVSGVQTGLEAMRDLHLGGYENVGSLANPQVMFPLDRVAQQLTTTTDQFAVVNIQNPVQFLMAEVSTGLRAPEDGFWTILQDRYQGDLDEICTGIVKQGAEAVLTDVPQGIFGGLFTVDRQEIESFRSIRTLASEYLNQDRPKRPLSIGVFGAPGSGKSFGITQVANSLAPGKIKVLEFNLSQFESTDELADALHQVRDVNLSGKFPLVFWDEFDTPLFGEPLGWLRYFLSPMQDGAFREGQIMHPIGPAIFVFAGGTSERMASFGQGLDKETFKGAKVPDFISRLKGFVNVLGPNPQVYENGDPSTVDPFYIIRRAILLRSILWRNARHLFEPKDGIQLLSIDKGVLRAFLKTRFYKHGIRSMESIVSMSQLTGKTRYERSSLPSEAQLDLHVDGQEFLALVQQIELTRETLDELAILFHRNFCEQLIEQGYVYGEFTDDDAKVHSSLRDFYDLPEDEQEQNRDTVRHIYSKLAASGFIMIPARSNQRSFTFPGTFLEELAIMEHERYRRMKLADGWKWAPETDKANKKHTDLGPWEELSEIAKAKDREFVQAIPGILAKVGYTIVEYRPLKEGD
jgi:hypothetical protein